MNQLVYVIDVEASQNEKTLVLLPAFLTHTGAISLVAIAPKEALQHASRSRAFKLGYDAEMQHRRKTSLISSTDPIQKIHIHASATHALFEALCEGEKLYYKDKDLTLDPYARWSLSYLLAPKTADTASIEAMVHLREKVVPFEEFVPPIPGNPPWLIQGRSLREADCPLSFDTLCQLQKKEYCVARASVRDFLELIEEEDAPQRWLWVDGSLDAWIAGPPPTPMLVLRDRWGACADLAMLYEGRRIAFHDPDIRGRRRDAELGWERDLLETDYIKKDMGTSHYHCPMNKIGKSLRFLLELGWKIESSAEKEILLASGWSLETQEREDAFQIQGRLSYGAYEADLSQMLGAFNRKETFVDLSSNTVGLVPDGELEIPLKNLSQEAEQNAEGIFLKKNRFSFLPSATGRTIDERWKSFQKIHASPPNMEFLGTLRPYQQDGVNWLSFLSEHGFHGILADQMGLGKTIQILAFLSRLPKNAPHLIVMPTSLLFNWEHELRRFLPSFSVCIHRGGHRTSSKEALQVYNVILTSYPVVRTDLELLRTLRYECIILDEAQAIKNHETQIGKALCALHSNMRLCVTGTPVENHFSDLWSHFHFLMPDLLGDKQSFEKECRAGEGDPRFFERLRKKISPFILRRTHEEVALELPARVDQKVWLEMAQEQQDLYDLVLRDPIVKQVKIDGVQKHRAAVFELLLRLRQVCCDPHLYCPETIENPPHGTKWDLLWIDLEEVRAAGKKALVYSQFTSMLRLLEKEASQRNLGWTSLDGTTRDREGVVRAFQSDPNISVFFISLKAGGVGLNLTAADYVILYDPWWNQAAEEQAIHRAHRIGRGQSLSVKRYLISGSIEEKMERLKARKEERITRLIDTADSPLDVTPSDLEFLFQAVIDEHA